MTILRSKNKSEAVANISSKLNIPDDWKDIVIELIMNYSKGRPSLKKYPSFVTTHNTKPSFALNDGDTLFGSSVQFQNGGGRLSYRATPVKYMGSADSAFWYQKEQFSSGHSAPDNCVGVFITEHASSSTRIWSVDVWAGERTKIHQSNKAQIGYAKDAYIQIVGFSQDDFALVSGAAMRRIAGLGIDKDNSSIQNISSRSNSGLRIAINGDADVKESANIIHEVEKAIIRALDSSGKDIHELQISIETD